MTELEKLEKELLEEIQEEPEIYADTEEFCTINPETRIITVPTSKRILGTESDQETNRLYFKCPKIVGDNVDLSLFSLRINYQNAGNKKDQYLVEDVKEEGDNITFSWLLKRNVTAYKGNVKFILCAVKTTEDGIIKNEWNTTLNTECESLEGMEVDKVAVEEETKDIVEQLIAMMNHSAENAVRAVEEAKAEVDKEVGDFALKAQQALADVNNAGQTQKERVQSAGTTAVENIQTTQGTATEAVETAKSEAVQAIQAEGTIQTGNVTTEGTKQVQAVADKGKEVLQSIPEDFQIQMGTKLDKNQGAENAGKALVVGEDGNVVLKEVQGGGSQGKPETWSEIAEIVKSGKAQEVFKIGDKFVDKWTDKATGQEYDWTWDVVHFGNVTLENGETVPGMYLQAHYLTPFVVQFDHEENEKATEPTFSRDYSYYTKNPDGSYKLEEVVVGQQIPSETQYYHSAIKDPTGNICRYGYNRWSHSAYRQWLNSDSAEKGKWWTAQHLGDVAPNKHNSRAGFLSGFEQDFLSVIKKVKIRTQLNTITDKDVGTDEETVDLMFLPSKEQLYGTLEGSIYNDEAFEYYKQVAGFEAPNNGNSTGRIKYKLDAQTSADWQRLRSPFRGDSSNTWLCGTAGNLTTNLAIDAGRCAPACVIA